ncbi:hypothetical protein [Actinoplanes sp. GCM10030250]|uniref:hypothetical protein n=1 Tax=Actinoplanes sp. GCM10030250 TaxID=3273376 RepID=UPI00362274DE
MDDIPLDVNALPGIVAGPVLRRVTRSAASVWVALTRPGTVTLHVRVAGQPATEIEAGTAEPVRVGVALWLAVVTGGAPGGTFDADGLYEYRLSSAGWPQPAWADLAIGTALPAFPGPPDDVAKLTILHTSCRKVHGGGRDALAGSAQVIRDRLSAGEARPHLLVLSGDQIYADEVPAPLVPRIARISTDLVGVEDSAMFAPLPRIGGRQTRSEQFHLTSSAARDHLWRLGEFLAVYLLYWSDLLWPAALPAWADVQPGALDPASGLDEQTWQGLRDATATFRAGLPEVRRVLATVPSLMVLDDHEVTDDWNLDHPWVAGVYADSAGSRIVTNGLLAYALCQHWGNVPARFATAGTPEAAVLAAVAFTGSSPDTLVLRKALGLPAAVPPAPPSVLRDLTDPAAVRYDVTLGPADGWPVRVIGLDERTAREFRRVDHPAARIGLAALSRMLPGPDPAEAVPLTLVVAPSPILGTHVIEHVIQPAVGLFPGGSVYADFESWSAATASHQELLRRLAAYAPLVFLSGDVHYGGTAALSYTRAAGTTRAAQITSSSARNADTKTMVLHLFGDLAMRLGIERERHFVGFTNLNAPQLAGPPPAGTTLPYDDLSDVLLGRAFRAGQEAPAVLSAEVAAAYGLGAGDWHYAVEPVDDETMPPAGPLLTDLQAAPAPAWPTWDPAKSYRMVKALRASDLHRIGRMFIGLPQISLLEFSTGPLAVHHHMTAPAGAEAAGVARHRADTRVELS